MRAALEGRAAAAPAAARVPDAGSLVLAVSAVLLGASLFFGGGADEDRLLPIGVAAVVVAAAAAAAIPLGLLPQPRLDVPALAVVALVAASAVWSAVSIVWSIAPDRSWAAFNRGVVYLALLVLGIVLGASVGRVPRVVAAGLAAAFGLVVLWALAGKVVPDLGPDNARSARLRAPVGYWNALGLLVAMSLPLWLWLAARRVHKTLLRGGATAMLVLALVAIALTTSRGSVLVGSAAIGAWLVIGRPRLESVFALLVAVPIAVAVAWWAVQQQGVAQAGAAQPAARHDGAMLGVVLLVAVAVAGGLAVGATRWEARHPLDPKRRGRLRRLALVAAAVCAVAGLALGIARVGNPATWAGDRLDEFRNPPSVQVPNSPERIVQFSSNHRWTWWQEAARIFADQPLGGTGAATFALARRPLRNDTQAPLAPHDVALQALSETGVVGLALLLALVGASAWAVRRALGRLPFADRAASAALAAALVAYLAHSVIDIGWEYIAVSAPCFLALGVLLSAGRPVVESSGERRPGLALVAAAVALTAVASLASPWLAQRRVDAAYDAIARGDLNAAASEAKRAADLNPLSVQPLHVHAAAEEIRGDLPTAERLYADAVDLQPENPETWYELGRFEFEARGDLGAALRFLDRSYALDAFGPAGAELNEVRAAIQQQGSS
jgi:tetratricopeptide (TPR) repeat protein